ncbi:unnamed protein product [Microthlaspi erraticum]|uniref:Uncharacterized protein n=1 Tax=Microthlaspi erraticum TaxID=1685480 RepID=A0A6D2IGN4_9BRAS|nr:unnamed protein product [Microthlaspi erraticum]
MSRKGVIAKRVKTVQTALSRISAQTAQSGWPRNDVPRSAKVSVRLKSRPKSKTARPITQHDPGNIVPRSAKHTVTPAAHDQPREPGNKPRGRATLAYHGRCIRPSRERTSHVRPRNLIGQISSARPRRPTVNHPATTVPTRPRPDCPADRPDRPSQRRGRPEARFEARFHIFKPGLTLSRLKRPSTIYIAF